VVQGTFIFAYAVLAEATLSFLGVGAPPYIPSWGNVINAGGKLINEAPWIALFPAIAITVTGLGLNLLGGRPPRRARPPPCAASRARADYGIFGGHL